MNIAHNITAVNTYNKMNISLNASNKAMEKLSSGYKINRSADDAAGLSISEKMRSQIRGLNQASENAEQGVSMIQTAEGALNEDHAILHRIRELAIQAANDTNSREDRDSIQNEINELISEINRIGNTTEFNGMKLLNGTFSSDGPIQVCAKGGDLDFNISKGVTNNANLEFIGGIQISSSDVIEFNHLDTTKENYIKISCNDGSLVATYSFNDTNGNTQKVVNKQLSIDESGNYFYDNNGITFKIEKDSVQKFISSNPTEDDFFKLDFQVACDGLETFNAKKTYNTKNDYENDSSQYGFIKNFHLDDYSIDRLNYDNVEIIYDNNDYRDKDTLKVIFYKDGEKVIEDTLEGKGNGPGIFIKQYDANGIRFDLEGSDSFETNGRIHAKIDLKEKLGVESVGYRQKIVNNRSENTVDNYMHKTFYQPAVTLSSSSRSISVYENEKLLYPQTNITFEADDTGFIAKFTGYDGKEYRSKKTLWHEPLSDDYTVTYNKDSFAGNTFAAGKDDAFANLNLPFNFSISKYATLDEVKATFNDTGRFYISASPSNSVTYSLYTSEGIWGSQTTSLNYKAIIASNKNLSASDTEFIEGNGKTGSTYNNISFDPTASGNESKTISFKLSMVDAAGSTIPLTYTLTGISGRASRFDDEYRYTYWDYDKEWDPEDEEYHYTTRIAVNVFSGGGTYNDIKNLVAGSSHPLNVPGGTITLSFELKNDNAMKLPDGSSLAANSSLGTASYGITVNQGMTVDVIKDIISSIQGADLSDSTPQTSYYFYNYNNSAVNSTVNMDYDKIEITEDVTYKEISPNNDDIPNGLNFHVGANKNQVVSSSFSDMRASRLGLTGYGEGYTKNYTVNNGVSSIFTEKGLSVQTRTDANLTIERVDKAINIVSSERSKLGAIQNRLEYTINNLDTTSENMTSAESTIRDVDMASEMMELTKNQILQQVSQAMLTQAMQTPQQVLQLLQ